jgi:hypothetical protein
MTPRIDWQPDAATVLCGHGSSAAQAGSGDDRAHLEARAIMSHMLGAGCECWRALARDGSPQLLQALHDVAVSMGAKCKDCP